MDGAEFRVAVLNVDCETGRDRVERFYQALAKRAHSPQIRVGGFECIGMLADTEVTCSRGDEWIFASSRPEDHPAHWNPPPPEPFVKIHPGHSGLVIDLLLKGDQVACEDHRTRAAIAMVDARSKLTLRTSDVCQGGSWRKRGKAPGLTLGWEVWHSRRWSGSSVYLGESILPASREYRLKVVLGARHLHGWLTVRHTLWSSKRIYEGTDAFVNYCIDRGKTLRSSNGRLYCVRQVPGHSVLAIHPHRW